jgi:ATP/ADP translocase
MQSVLACERATASKRRVYVVVVGFFLLFLLLVTTVFFAQLAAVKQMFDFLEPLQISGASDERKGCCTQLRAGEAPA